MENHTFEQLIEELKSKADLADEIGKSGVGMQDVSRGKYLYGLSQKSGGPGDSLMVDLYRQTYCWWAKGGNQGRKGEAYGDVFDWLETYRKMEFWEAAQYLAGEYGVAIPKVLDREPSPGATAFRERVALFDVVARWLSAQLAASSAAMDYARGRGWTDETIGRARLGYTGHSAAMPMKVLKTDLEGELRMYGHDPRSPGAVSLLGLPGGREALEEWANSYKVDLNSHPNWLEKGRIYGMLDFPRLVYAHISRGKVVYFSCRNLEWDDKRLVGKSGKFKTWNLPRVLAGERRVYFNESYYAKARQVVVCEGPADGVTWGQWEIPAVCLVGTSAGEDLMGLLRKHETVYLGMDNGAAGRQAIDRMGRELGPDCWVLRYPLGKGGEDANDWLQAMIESKAVEGRDDLVGQVSLANSLLNTCELFALRMASQAGALAGGPKKAEAVKEAVALISQLDVELLDQNHKKLRDALGYGAREFNRLLGREEKKSKARDEAIPTLGGPIGDWLVEYCYDAEEGEALLAYRDPDRRVGVERDLLIDGTKYIPYPTIDYVTRGAVKFPSTMADDKQDVMDLIYAIELFVLRYYLLDDDGFARIMAYYVLLTWMYDAFKALPYLRAMGDYGTGKSELMQRVGHLCYRMTMASGANTEATFFRTTELFRGTVFIDEADLHDGGDMANAITKFINLGAMKGNFITRMVEKMDFRGERILVPEPFDPFCPKLIAMRRDFKDKAVGSRCLTIHLMGKSTEELLEREVPLQVGVEFFEQALALRNRLLRWRLDNWVPSIAITNEMADVGLSARLNQVTMPMKALAIATGDKKLEVDITKFLRKLALQETQERSITVFAYIVEAGWEIRSKKVIFDEKFHFGRDGEAYIWMADWRELTNTIMDELNKAGSVSDGEGKGKKEITAQGMGVYLKELGIEKGNRQGQGVPVLWDEVKMVRLGRKYGVLARDYEVEEDAKLPPLYRMEAVTERQAEMELTVKNGE